MKDTAVTAIFPSNGNARRWRVLIMVLTCCSLYQVVAHDFSTWDDINNVAINPDFNPVTLRGVLHYWTAPKFDLYVPVTYTVWGALALLAKVPSPDELGSTLNPYVYHGANLLIHLISVQLVFELLRRVLAERDATRQASIDLPACLGALIFAVHPVQVETVGWVAGTKDLLAGLFSIAALLIYVGGARELKPARGSYVLATVLFVLAMLSKPSAIATPLMALGLDWAMGTLTRERLRTRVLPWVMLMIPCAIVGKLSQQAMHVDDAPLWQRPLIAADALAFYLAHIAWPDSLGIDYGRTPTEIFARGWAWYTWTLPAALAAGLWLYRKKLPLALAGAVIFVAALAPVLGLVTFDFQLFSTVADHYLYVAMVGVALAVSTLLVQARHRDACITIVIVFILGFGVRSWHQSRTWQNSETIFTNGTRNNDRSGVSFNNLYEPLAAQKRYLEGLGHLRRALDIAPTSWLAMKNLAQGYLAGGHLDVAVPWLEKAMAAPNTDVTTQPAVTLGQVLADLGRRDEAIAMLRRFIPVYDAAIQTRYDKETKRREEAILWAELGSHLGNAGRHAEAIEAFRTSLRFDPKWGNSIIGLAKAVTAEKQRAATQPVLKP